MKIGGYALGRARREEGPARGLRVAVCLPALRPRLEDDPRRAARPLREVPASKLDSSRPPLPQEVAPRHSTAPQQFSCVECCATAQLP